MVSRFLLSGVLVALLAVCTKAAEERVTEVPSEPPVVYSTMKYGAWGLARVRILRMDPERISLKLLRPSPETPLQRVAQMPGCAEAIACFNGSFFLEESNQPIGLLVDDGALVQPLQKVNWGVFWMDRKGRPHIDRRGHFARHVKVPEEVLFALQSGPTILFDGELQERPETDLARRTAVGIDGQGRLLVLVANFPVTLNGLARFAKEKLAACYLMNLDGGSSTQLSMRNTEGTHRVIGFPVAVGVAVLSR